MPIVALRNKKGRASQQKGKASPAMFQWLRSTGRLRALLQLQLQLLLQADDHDLDPTHPKH